MGWWNRTVKVANKPYAKATNIIRSPYDAKRCGHIFGIRVNRSNKNVKKVLWKLQGVINQYQYILCTSKLRYFALDKINSLNLEKRPDRPVADVKKELRDSVYNNGRNLKIQGVPNKDVQKLQKLMIILGDTIISVSTVDGKVKGARVKQLMLDMLSSFCRKYKAPPLPKTGGVIKTQTVTTNNVIKSKFGEMMEEEFGEMSEEEFGEMSEEEFGEMSEEEFTEMTEEEFGEMVEEEFGEMSEEEFGEMSEEEFGEMSEEEFGEMDEDSMSTFGKSSGSMMMWLILLIVLAVAAYFLYKNKDKMKIPSLSRQISSFGRQIKAVRRM
jgi:hypothetical protein